MIVDFHTHVFPDEIAESTVSALADKTGNFFSSLPKKYFTNLR